MSGECGVGRLLNGRDFCNDVLDSTCVMYAESPRGEYLITMQSCSCMALADGVSVGFVEPRVFVSSSIPSVSDANDKGEKEEKSIQI